MLVLVSAYSAICQAAQLEVLPQKESVFFVVSAQKGDEIILEKADFNLIYGLDLEIYQGETLYSLSAQDIEFQFPETITLYETMLVGRTIGKKQLAELFRIKQAGSYLMVTTFCLSDGRCLDKVKTQLQFLSSDL